MPHEKIQFGDNVPFRVSVQKITRYPIHWHEGVTEIILPIRGDVEVVANFEHLTVREGDFYFINNRSVHSIRSGTNAVVVVIYVNLAFFGQQFEYLPYMFFRSNTFVDDRGAFFKDINMDDNVRFRNLLIDILLRKISYELLGDILKNLGNRLIYSMVFDFNWLRLIKSNEGPINSAQYDRYHRIVKYIDDHYAEKITLDDIVSSEYITKTYFSHFWKKLSNYSFTERVNYERVLKSEYLLLTDQNILKISEQCGFSDVKYYYRNFKRWYGCLPSEHRNRCRNYTRLGADYEVMELIYFNRELEDYANQYLFIECNLNDGMTESSYIDHYMKMKLLSKPGSPTTGASKSITLNPFQPNHFIVEDSGLIMFHWHTIDLAVNISMDTGFPLSIGFQIDSVDQHLLHDALSQFLEGCLYRYGMRVMERWDYTVNYKNILSFDKTISIEKIITDKIKNAKIVHNFEF